MWDSLESIWQAANEDENCDAYVVPIPYCDRNPDGSPKTWHYEGDEFPKYVPITDWQKYNLEEHKPDAIYIHNPYDDYNLVTSVHPQFYSNELKKYTDMLVYVPYFVVGDMIPEHFAKAPGIVNADKVIVQSEEIKKQYEMYYPGGNSPQDKFLALGSPKFDKVQNSRREDYDLPEKWKQLIKGKKAVLYNTTISAILDNADKFIEKLRYVFSIFKERKDVVLWWRPHPLLKATIESMLPQLLQEYERIVQEYKKSGWGIYDDSADLNRSIAWTDAYYGDMSSVVWLYKATGKPILLQSLKQDEGLYFDYMEPDGNDLWFIPLNYNGLFKMSLNDGKIDFVGYFPNEKPFTGFRYRTLKRIDDKIIIIPWFGDSIIKYDINTNSFKKQPIKVFENHNINGQWKYNNFLIGMAKYNKYIFMFGFQPVIVRYDIETNELMYFGDWSKDIDLDYANTNGLMWREHCVKDKLLFINILRTNKILVFNMETCTYKFTAVGSEEDKYSQINFDGEYFWLTHSNKVSLTRWNLKTDEFLVYNIDGEKGQEKDSVLALRGTIIVDENLYILPGMKKAMIKINTKSGNINILNTDLFSIEDIQKSVFKLYCDCAVVDEKQEIFIMKSSDLSLSILDRDFVSKKQYRMLLPEEIYQELLNKGIKSNDILKENGAQSGIVEYINILNEMKKQNITDKDNQNVGVVIHNNIYCK